MVWFTVEIRYRESAEVWIVPHKLQWILSIKDIIQIRPVVDKSFLIITGKISEHLFLIL